MSEELARSADHRSQVNEKLLTALIALLAVKDEHLLEELSVIFAHAQHQESGLGRAPPEVWADAIRQLSLLLDLASVDDQEEATQNGRTQ